jgi:hypothetical protein
MLPNDGWDKKNKRSENTKFHKTKSNVLVGGTVIQLYLFYIKHNIYALKERYEHFSNAKIVVDLYLHIESVQIKTKICQSITSFQ